MVCGGYFAYNPKITPEDILINIYLVIIFFNVYLFLRQRETEHERGRVRERGGHRIWNRLQALSCRHRAWRGAQTHKPWDHDLSWSRTLNRLSHPGAPVYLFLRETETECEWVRGREREGDTEAEAGSRLWAVSTQPDVGLKLTSCEIMTWAEVGRSTDWATQAPLNSIFLCI